MNARECLTYQILLKIYLKVGNEDKVQSSKNLEFLFFLNTIFFLINLVFLINDKKENVESLRLKKSRLYRVLSIEEKEENRIKKEGKSFPLPSSYF